VFVILIIDTHVSSTGTAWRVYRLGRGQFVYCRATGYYTHAEAGYYIHADASPYTIETTFEAVGESFGTEKAII
jgi:hypothetical protein